MRRLILMTGALFLIMGILALAACIHIQVKESDNNNIDINIDNGSDFLIDDSEDGGSESDEKTESGD